MSFNLLQFPAIFRISAASAVFYVKYVCISVGVSPMCTIHV